MNILLIGSGGREHALAWKLTQSPLVERLWASPGNPGVAADIAPERGGCVALEVADHRAVARFCRENAVDLVVVGPEAPLVAGLADALREAGIAVFGPSRAAAQLEGSKGFTKDLCQRAGIPTAGYVRAATRADALAALDRFEAPYVIKADGLAAGKGVVIAPDRAEAEAALAAMFGGGSAAADVDADSGAEVVIEEFMAGEEASFFALTDGTTIVPFGSAQDHKRVGEGDTGPNTGGMGAYSPAPVLTPELEEAALSLIVRPTVETLAREGTPYSGVLYAGLMLTDSGPKLIEYNCRFGDPECQVLMARLDSDLAELLLACAQDRLAATAPPRFAQRTALTVVMAANGYPGTPEKGGAIALNDAEGMDADGDSAKIFHAGTALAPDGTLRAAGGRVLAVTASGADVTHAQAAAYRAVDAVDFPGGFCRRDIGWREVAREAGDGAA